ncbi:MAG: SLC13 family permease, partial [Casimicrobium sp.]
MNSIKSAAATVASLSPHGLAMLIFAGVVFALFIWDRVPIATVCLGILTLLPLGFVLFPFQDVLGTIEPLRFFAGFGHPALVAICALMVVGRALEVTGALAPAARKLSSWFSAAPTVALLVLLVGAAAVSGSVNDTPVVVLLIPLIMAAAGRAKLPAATMLLPMNYAVLIGGMSTTIGTSTNLIVVAIAASLGVGPFGLFSFFPIVALVAVPALLYLWLVAPRLLAHVKPQVDRLAEDVFDAELHVEAGAWLDGKELREALQASGNKLRIIELRRGNNHVSRLPSLKLRKGDRLLVQDTASNLKDYETSLKAKLHSVRLDRSTDNPDDPAADSEAAKTPTSSVVAMLIVTLTSTLIGRTVREARIAERYNVIVVGVRPGTPDHRWQRSRKLSDRVIQASDILLLQGTTDSIKEAQQDGIGLLLDEQFALPRQEKAMLALLVMAAVVVLAATKTLPISIAAVGGALALLLTRCLSWQEVAQSMSAKVILLVSASLALGDALTITGATTWLAGMLASVSTQLSPAWLLTLLMGIMGLLTNFVSNNASAAIGTPLAIELARTLGMPP